MKDRLKTALNLKFDDNITAHDIAVMADLFCALNFNSIEFRQKIQKEKKPEQAVRDVIRAEEDANTQQAEVGMILAACYEHGNAELALPRDPWRAKKYGHKAHPSAKKKRTEDVYTRFGWYTSMRLFALRLNRILSLVGKGFYVDIAVETGIAFLNTICNAITKNITKITAIAGLSYGIELLVDSSVLLRATFFPTEDETTQNPSSWSRFKNTFNKDDRILRMANAAIWFSGNLAAFFLSAGLSSIVNLALFVSDVCIDVYKAYRDKSKYVRLSQAIQNKKADLSAEIQLTKEPKQSLKEELEKYNRIEVRLKQKTDAVIRKRYHAIFISVIILTGMILFLYPPAGAVALMSLFAVKMLGASLALAGSVFGGLGKRVYDKITARKPVDIELDNEITPPKTPIQPIILPPTSVPPIASVSPNSSISPIYPPLFSPEKLAEPVNPATDLVNTSPGVTIARVIPANG